MTSDDWKKVEKRLENFYDIVELNCDGYKVELVLTREKPMKNNIVIYINGVIKGEWITNDCEERRRFFRPVKKYLYPQKYRASMKKEPKWLQREFPNTDRTYTFYVPDWLSFKALKSHLIKNNENIELITKEQEEANENL